jgi:conflict system STAND superfamily ATPase
MGVAVSGVPYRFDDLGWLQFESLCLTLLDTLSGVDAGDWHRSGSVTALLAPDGIAPPGQSAALTGPTLVLVVWIRPRATASSPFQRLQKVLDSSLAEWSERNPRSLLVLANVPAKVSSSELEVAMLGPDELTPLVKGSWPLRLRVPTVLGIGAGADLLDAAAADASTADLEAARVLARVFVPTRTYAAAIDALGRHHFVVLTGPPEMGKTAIARTIGLAAVTGGWEVHECLRPEELWERFRRNRSQVFIADDAFGSTEYRPESAEHWALELDRILRAMDGTHWLIWTSRPAPFKAGLRRIHREHGVERFPQPAQVQVDAADLDVAEKALILFRHGKAASLSPEALALVKVEGWAIVRHPHFTPERIRRFVAGRLPGLSAEPHTSEEIEAAVAAEIREPTEAMSASFNALSDEHRALLVALLDTPPGPVGERELTSAFRRHSDAGLVEQPAELVDRLTDHFLRLVDARSVTWVHPSWRDLVIDQLIEDATARESFLRRSSVDGLLLALSTAGGTTGERLLPLLHEDRDWDAAGDQLAQLVPTLDHPDLTRLFIALDEACAATVDDGRRGELRYLVEGALSAVARRWSRERTPIAVGVLHWWLQLASLLADPPPVPELMTTWIELAPTASVDVHAREEIIRFDDWTTLCEVLGAYAGETLAAFGFPDRQRDVIDSFVSAAEATEPAALARAERELLAASMRRLGRLGATDVARARDVAIRLLAVPQEPELPEVHMRRRLSRGLREILEAPIVEPRSDEALVARVLRDL